MIRATRFLPNSCFVLAAFLLLGTLSCGEIGPPVRNPTITESDLPPSYLIGGVPWYRQNGNECGPASLAMVLNYYHVEVKKEDIVKWAMRFDQRGADVQQLEYYAQTRQGLKVYRLYDPSKGKAQVKCLIAQGYPLIAVGRIPPRWHSKSPLWEGHAIVVVGYDDPAGNFIIQDPAWGRMGREQTRVPYTVFNDFLYHPAFPNMVLCLYRP